MRITALTCVKNEGPFLLEWIAFNRIIGVTDFLFYLSGQRHEALVPKFGRKIMVKTPSSRFTKIICTISRTAQSDLKNLVRL